MKRPYTSAARIALMVGVATLLTALHSVASADPMGASSTNAAGGVVSVSAGNSFVNSGTGAAQVPYSFLLPAGMRGHTPALTLSYSSGSGVGQGGFGWHVLTSV